MKKLKIMKKITIVNQRPIEFTGSSGDDIRGFMLLGFLEDGKAVEFFSKNSHEVFEGETGFVKGKSEEITLKAKIRKDGKIGWTEITE